MKAWNHTPGVTYPKTPRPCRRVRYDEPRIDAAAIAALFGCTRAHARRIGAAHGAPVTRAVDPASGKSVCYYRAAGIAARFAALQAPAKPGNAPAGFCSARRAAALCGSYFALQRLCRRGVVLRIPGHAPSGRFCYWYRLADLRPHTTR